MLPYGIDGWSHRTVPQDCIESLAGFFPRFPPSQPEDFHVTIILTDKTLKQAYRGGGTAAVAAARPRSSPRRRSGRFEPQVALREVVYEYEYCHTMRQRCARTP